MGYHIFFRESFKIFTRHSVKIVLFLMIVSSKVCLADINSSISDGDWNDPVNWSVGSLPVPGDSVYVYHKLKSQANLYFENNFVYVGSTGAICTSDSLVIDSTSVVVNYGSVGTYELIISGIIDTYGEIIFPNATISGQLNIHGSIAWSPVCCTNDGPVPNPYIHVYDTICKKESYTFPDGLYIPEVDTSVTYISEFLNIHSCDSNIVTHLTVGFETEITDASNSWDDKLKIHPSIGISYVQWLDCDNNFEEIPGENGIAIYPDELGSYSAVITANGCMDTLECYDFNSFWGVDEHDKSSKVMIYPNPTTDQVTIEVKNIHKTKAIITDINGRIMNYVFLENGSVSIDTHTWHAGVYFLHISSGNGTIYTKKIIKE